MKNTARTLMMALPFLIGTIAFAQQQTFTVNPGTSSVGFALTGTGHEVHGTFHVSSGTILFDRSVPQMSGKVVVSAGSGESGDNGRDKNMHQKVLETDRFTDIIFQPQSYTGALAATAAPAAGGPAWGETRAACTACRTARRRPCAST